MSETTGTGKKTKVLMNEWDIGVRAITTSEAFMHRMIGKQVDVLQMDCLHALLGTEMAIVTHNGMADVADAMAEDFADRLRATAEIPERAEAVIDRSMRLVGDYCSEAQKIIGGAEASGKDRDEVLNALAEEFARWIGFEPDAEDIKNIADELVTFDEACQMDPDERIRTMLG